MKILLVAINAKYIHSNLALYSLRSYAKAYMQENVEIEIGEYTINHQVGDILEKIYRAKPDVLCFSCYIWNMDYVQELAEEYHKLCPNVPIWLGGPEVSYEVEQYLPKHPEVTGIMIGEGEETFTELCQYYAAGEGCERKAHPVLADIAGLAYRSGDGVCVTAPRAPIDMSSIPFCYERMEDFTNRIVYYESSRGCPFRCSYCLSSVEKQLRFRDTALVKQELGFFMEKEVPQVKFVDRTFNCKHEHAMEIWSFIQEHDNGITNFHFEISADLLTEEELELLATMRPGLVQLEIGVQSTNEATITEIHRTMELKRLKEVVKRIQLGKNIHEHLDLIAGLPYEDYDTFAKSFDEIYALKPNQLQLGFLKVLKGSYMYEHASEYGIVYSSRPPYEVLRTKWLDFPELLKIRQAEEMLEVYYNSGQYEVTMKMLETQFASAFVMFRRLGEFYDRQGYFAMSHSRIRRAEILLEFAEEYAKQAVPVLKESLTFDLYYRENMKSRPDWASDVSEWKNVTRQYCKNGKTSHVEQFHYCFPGKETRGIEKLPERTAQPVYILFDYTQRDPLDHQAIYKDISLDVRENKKM
jgi:radical SAM superfamily enzyme YgiQ (UPF0313 family)